jgi:hypothetical protein
MDTDRKARLRRAAVAALLALSVLSLGGWAPLRRVEQAPAVLLRPLEELCAALVPEREAGEAQVLEALVGDARLAFAGWEQSLLREGPASPPGTQRLLAPVLARDTGRRELRLLAPAGAVRAGAPATHRTALVGFVASVEPGPEAGTELAVVQPLGRAGQRAVAAEWSTGPQARPVQVLVGADGRDDPRRPALPVVARSSSVPPPPDQLCWTRDVSSLGDSLPAGLLLGRLEAADGEAPGGAARLRLGDALVVRPLLDPFALDLLALAAAPGAAREPRRLGARLAVTSRGPATLRLDRGARDGVRAGDWVTQAGLWLGVVSDVGAGTAVVDAALPHGPLLCVTRAGEVRTLGLLPGSWPEGWQPVRGDLLALGRPATGGLLVGLVAGVDEDGLRVERLEPDASRAVTVWGP